LSAIPCPVPWCDRPRPGDRQLCGACEADLARALGDVPWLARQLDITLAKQGSHAGGGRSASIPLPYDPRATEANYVLRSALVGWVRVQTETILATAGPVCERCAHPSCRWITHTLTLPGDTLPSMARWLLEDAERLAMHAAAEEAVDEIVSAVRSGIRLIDRPPVLWFAGPCTAAGCSADLYARTDAARVQCRDCGATYDVVARRQWLLDAIEDALFHAAGAAHVLTSLGWPCAAGRIRLWAHRGRLVAHGVDGQGRPVYRIGEIRELLVEAAQRSEERREKAG
jgi:hypothetical protein